jgi:hypothetical protein
MVLPVFGANKPETRLLFRPIDDEAQHDRFSLMVESNAVARMCDSETSRDSR